MGSSRTELATELSTFHAHALKLTAEHLVVGNGSVVVGLEHPQVLVLPLVFGNC
jgi:hypothetical protein